MYLYSPFWIKPYHILITHVFGTTLSFIYNIFVIIIIVVVVIICHYGIVIFIISRDAIHVIFVIIVKVWNLERGEMIAGVEMHNEPRLVRFNQTGELVLVGCKNNQVSIWNWQRQGALPRSVVLPAFTTMEIAARGDTVYTCSRNDEVCQIELANNNVSKVSQGPNPGHTSMVILPDGEAILSGIMTESLFIYWELSSWREIRYNAAHPSGALVTTIDITSDGELALSGSNQGSLSQVHLQSSEIIKCYENTRIGKGICFVAVLKNDLHFAFVDETNTVELRSLDDTECVVLGQPSTKITSVCAIGSEFLLVGCKNGVFVLFDTAGIRGSHQGPNGAVTQLANRTGNKFLYFVSGYEDGSVKLWFLIDTQTPRWINLWSCENVHDYPVTALAFIPGSEDIVAGSSGNDVKRINGTGIVRSYVFKSYGIAALRVVGDCLIAACVRGFSVVKWSLDNGSVLKRVHGGAGREQVARIFLPTGHVVTKGSHHNLMHWDLYSGNKIRRLCGHTHDIRALAFVPGGAYLLSGSRDKVLKLWSLETGVLVDEFHFERFVLAIACASNGIVCVGLQGGQVCFMRVNNLTKPS